MKYNIAPDQMRLIRQEQALFDEVAQRLHDTDTLVPYPSPLGTEQQDWPSWAKPPISPYFSPLRGCVEWPGDEPYCQPTVDEVAPDNYNDLRLTSGLIQLRATSLHKAIKQYVPNDAYQHWFNVFIDTLALPAHRIAVSKSIRQIPRQFNIYAPGIMAPDDLLRERLRDPHDPRHPNYVPPNRIHPLLLRSSLRFEAEHHPETLAALAIYHASYRPYLNNLDGALFDAPFPWQEKMIGNSVLEYSLATFKEFILFGTFLPIVLLEKKDLLAASGGRMSDEEAGLAAITKAWKTFKDARILRREFPEMPHLDPMVCPAISHLLFVMKTHIIEKAYRFVLANRERDIVLDIMAEAQTVTRHAVRKRLAYNLHYTGRAALKLQQTRTGAGARHLVL